MSDLKNVQPLSDFNWDEFEKGEVACSASRQEQEAAYDGTLNNVKDQEIVIGTVTKIGKREVLVNIGFKSEGAINSAEFRYNPDLQVGDKVEVFRRDSSSSHTVRHVSLAHGIVSTKPSRRTKWYAATSSAARRVV